MRSVLVVAITALLLEITTVRAQEVDVAEITCGDFTDAYLEQFVVLDAWLNGYYHGKANKTAVDRKKAAENTQKVVQFCKSNPNVKVMQAIEKIIAG